jgi:DNA-binding NarL/FixJ family response regulator
LINIAIVENNSFYRESLKTALNQIDGFNVVLDVDKIASMLDFIDENIFHIILLDSSYYQAETLRKVIQLYSDTKILILSDSIESYFLDQQLDGISFDFIPKSSTKSLFEIKIRDSFNPSLIFNI